MFALVLPREGLACSCLAAFMLFGCEKQPTDPESRVQQTYDIAYVSGSSAFVCNQRGTNIRRISGTFPVVGKIAWSSDGGTLAFLAQTNDQHLFLTSRDSDNPIPIMSSVYLEPSPLAPIWSPDGSKIATVKVIPRSSAAPWYAIAVYSLADSSLRIVTPDSVQALYPAWSPNGSRIAFVGFKGYESNRLFVVDADGTSCQQLGQREPQVTPQWSPDGTRIAYKASSQIAILTLSTNSDVLILPTSADEPRWSPSGNKILFVSHGDLWIMSPDGSSQENLTQSPSRQEQSGSWSPDGRQVAYSVSDSLFTIDIASRVASFVVTPAASQSTPSWSPVSID